MFCLICKQVLVRIGGKNDPVVIETTLNNVVQKQVQKILHGLKGNLK